jgi:hypothetical protein
MAMRSRASVSADAGSGQKGGASSHVYQSTASVGDFLVVTIDKQAQTISYDNKTNGWSAEGVAYSVDTNGMYTFDDPNGHIKAAIEIEDYALIMDVDRAGPNRDTRALAIGALAEKVALSDLTGGDGSMKRYLHMQFRTRNGGMEVGYVTASSTGSRLTVDHASYWPLGGSMAPDPMRGELAYHVGEQPLIFDVPSGLGRGDFIQIDSAPMQGGDEEHLTLFKTGSGFAFDMANGNMILIAQPDTKAFNPAWAGTYRALAYEKRGAMGTSDNEPEPGTATVHNVDLTLDASGHLTGGGGGDGHGLDAQLISLPDADWLVGPGKLDAERSRGLFAFRTQGPNGTKNDVFVCFVRNGFLFASFSPTDPNQGPMGGPMMNGNPPMGSGPMGGGPMMGGNPSMGANHPTGSYGYLYGAALRKAEP